MRFLLAANEKKLNKRHSDYLDYERRLLSGDMRMFSILGFSSALVPFTDHIRVYGQWKRRKELS